MEHRTALAARIALVAVLAVSVVFGATHGFGLFDRHVDVLLIGDSIMSQSGPFVADPLESAPGVGGVKVQVEATPGTGLLTPALMDWQARAEELIEQYRPRIVVVLFVGNYTDQPDQQWPDGAGRPIPNDYGPAFFAAWRDQADVLTRSLARYGAEVDWVLPPPMLSAEARRRADGLQAAYEDVARGNPGVTLIDARPALGGPDGAFVWERPNVDGIVATVRTGDSLHLTADGGHLLARQMVATVAPQLVDLRQRERRS